MSADSPSVVVDLARDRFAGYEMQPKTCSMFWRTLAGSLVWRCGLRR